MPADDDGASEDLQKVLRLVARARRTSDPVRVRRQPSPEDREAALVEKDWDQDIAHKKTLVRWTLWITAAQLLVTNLGIYWYLWHVREEADQTVLVSWMSMTVLEVLGIVALISTYLFPSGGRRRRRLLRSE